MRKINISVFLLTLLLISKLFLTRNELVYADWWERED